MVRHKFLIHFVIMIFFLLFAQGLVSVQAADYDLLVQYAPEFQFTGNECCYPVDVEFFIENSALYRYSDSVSEVQNNTVTVALLGNVSATSEWYLDNKMGTITDMGIVSHYQSQGIIRGYTVYGNVVIEGDVTILQYWMFYVFNKGSLNVHEGDWEVDRKSVV